MFETMQLRFKTQPQSAWRTPHSLRTEFALRVMQIWIAPEKSVMRNFP
jgi:hypothetical protein